MDEEVSERVYQEKPKERIIAYLAETKRDFIGEGNGRLLS